MASLAAKTVQEFHLPGRFNTFRDNVKIKLLGHADDGTHNDNGVTVVGQICYEGPVDLQRVQREAGQVTE